MKLFEKLLHWAPLVIALMGLVFLDTFGVKGISYCIEISFHTACIVSLMMLLFNAFILYLLWRVYWMKKE